MRRVADATQGTPVRSVTVAACPCMDPDELKATLAELFPSDLYMEPNVIFVEPERALVRVGRAVSCVNDAVRAGSEVFVILAHEGCTQFAEFYIGYPQAVTHDFLEQQRPVHMARALWYMQRRLTALGAILNVEVLLVRASGVDKITPRLARGACPARPNPKAHHPEGRRPKPRSRQIRRRPYQHTRA